MRFGESAQHACRSSGRFGDRRGRPAILLVCPYSREARSVGNHQPAGVCVLISLQELQLHPVKFNVDIPAGEIEYDGRSNQVSALHAEGEARLVSSALGEIRIRGKLNAEMEAPCDRCLETAHCSVDNDIPSSLLSAEQLRVAQKRRSTKATAMWPITKAIVWSFPMCFAKWCCWPCRCNWFAASPAKASVPRAGRTATSIPAAVRLRPPDDRWSKLKTFSERDQLHAINAEVRRVSIPR